MPAFSTARGAERAYLAAAAAFLLVAPFPSSAGWRVFFLLAAAGALTWDAWQRHAPLGLRRIPRAVAFAWLAWALMAVASLAWSADRDYTLAELRRELLYGALAFLVFFLGTLETARLHLWLRVLAVGGLILTAGEWLRLLLPEAAWARKAGVGPGPFSTHVLMLSTLLAIALWPRPAGMAVGRRFLAVACLFFLVAGVAAESRMLWLAMLVAALGAFLVLRRSLPADHGAQAPATRAFLVALVAMPLLMAASAEYKLRYYPRATSAADSLGYDERPAVWQAAARKIAEHPWRGYGFGREIVADDIRSAAAAAGARNRLNHGHNMFVDALLQIGIPGAAALAALCIALGVALAALRTRPGGEPLAIAGVALLLGYVAKNSTDDFFARPNSLVFWALCGMLLGLGTAARRR